MFREKIHLKLVTCWIAVTDVPLEGGVRFVKAGDIGVYPYEIYESERGLPPSERIGMKGDLVVSYSYEDFVARFEAVDDHAKNLLAKAAYLNGKAAGAAA